MCVLAEQRRRTAVLHRGFRQPQRAGDERNNAGHRVRHLNLRAAGLHLRVFEDVGDGVDRPARHTDLFEQRDPGGGAARQREFAHQRDQHIAVGDARRVGDEARIVGPLRVVDGAAEACELAVVADRQDHETVLGRKVLVRHGVRVGVAHALRRAAIQMVHALVGEAGDLHVEQADVDVLADAGAVARLYGGQDGGARIHAGEYVGQRHADLDRARAFFAVGPAGDAHQAAHALHQEVIAGALGVRPGLAEAGDRAVDQARIDSEQRGVVEAVLGEAADLEVLDHHVAAFGEFAHQRLSCGAGEIDGNRFLVAVRAQKVGRVAGVLTVAVFQERRAPQTRVVATAGALDLDDFGAKVAQRLAGPGAGEHARQVQDAQVRQRAGSRGLFHGWTLRLVGVVGMVWVHCSSTFALTATRFQSWISAF